mmetsp:Transcript_81842/g.229566  ORF Transcript_81842/g.229566 Transcript_81842/m.229566 type:complete len:333 (-) Transcript_81842:212-1210(-)
MERVLPSQANRQREGADDAADGLLQVLRRQEVLRCRTAEIGQGWRRIEGCDALRNWRHRSGCCGTLRLRLHNAQRGHGVEECRAGARQWDGVALRLLVAVDFVSELVQQDDRADRQSCQEERANHLDEVQVEVWEQPDGHRKTEAQEKPTRAHRRGAPKGAHPSLEHRIALSLAERVMELDGIRRDDHSKKAGNDGPYEHNHVDARQLRHLLLGLAGEQSLHEQLLDNEAGQDASCLVLGLASGLLPILIYLLVALLGASRQPLPLLRPLRFGLRPSKFAAETIHDEPNDDQPKEDRRRDCPHHLVCKLAQGRLQRGDSRKGSDVAPDLARG